MARHGSRLNFGYLRHWSERPREACPGFGATGRGKIERIPGGLRDRAIFIGILRRCRSVTVLVLHRHYPPRRFVFYPLYRFLRRRLRLPMAISNLLVWVASAILHGGLLIACGNVPAGIFFAAVFLLLGVTSTGVVLAVKPTSRTVAAKGRET